MARVLGAQEGLRGMGHLWTCSIRDSQVRRGVRSSVSTDRVADGAWHRIGTHILNIIL